ncbi:hypothetical protein, partial [Serratia sp. M24T3]|uniref:hypothetical protein n=1 Tax=Serratia sp. M24T3 TaxID=932213 RepID=UPI00025BC0CB
NQQDILKANKNIPNRESDHESFNRTKIENKKNELSRLEQDHNGNLAHQKTKFESLEADKNKKIAELDSTHNDDKQIIDNEPELAESKNDYHDHNNSFERYRSLGQLSHAFGATTTSAFSIGTANERAKQANAELDSSVNHKTNDYNRERASSYKSSALEIINQILAILEKHNATIGEIARKC